jgi:hypothetical protein
MDGAPGEFSGRKGRAVVEGWGSSGSFAALRMTTSRGEMRSRAMRKAWTARVIQRQMRMSGMKKRV